jgi:uncharacterized protein (DUF58 family)
MAAGRGGGSDGISCTLAELLALRHTARSLSVKGGKPAWSIMAGSQLSRFRGRGMDYSESRIYTPGDDIRQIDWRVTARTGKLHTKLYTEERDRPILTLVDFSPSLYFGTREAFKSVIAARLAALVSWTAVFNSDRIGAILESPGPDFDLRPRAGRQGIMRLIQALVETSRNFPEHSGESFLKKLLNQALRTIRPGSRIFLISDFFNLYEGFEADLARLGRHNDLILCQVIDPLELAPPPAAIYPISDGHARSRLNTADPATTTAWREKFTQKRKRLEKTAGDLKLPRLEIVSGDDLAGCMRRGVSLKIS